MADQQVPATREKTPNYHTFENHTQSHKIPSACQDSTALRKQAGYGLGLKPLYDSTVSTNDTHHLTHDMHIPLFPLTAPAKTAKTAEHIPLPNDDFDESPNVLLATTSRPVFREYGPTILILLSTMITATAGCIIRYLTTQRKIPSTLIAGVKGFVQIILVTSLIVTLGRKDIMKRTTHRQSVLLFFFALFAAIGINLRFATLARLPVGIATSLISTAPIFCSVLGWVFLGQNLTSTDILSVVITTIGSSLIGVVNPNPERVDSTGMEVHVEGVILALLTAVMDSLGFVVLKKLGTSVHVLQATVLSGFSFMIGGFGALAIQTGGVQNGITMLTDVLKNADQEVQLGLAGAIVLGILAGLCINYGCQLLAPGRAGVLRTTEIPINFLLGFLVLHEFPTSCGIFVGSLLILLSTVLTAFKGASS